MDLHRLLIDTILLGLCHLISGDNVNLNLIKAKLHNEAKFSCTFLNKPEILSVYIYHLNKTDNTSGVKTGFDLWQTCKSCCVRNFILKGIKQTDPCDNKTKQQYTAEYKYPTVTFTKKSVECDDLGSTFYCGYSYKEHPNRFVGTFTQLNFTLEPAKVEDSDDECTVDSTTAAPETLEDWEIAAIAIPSVLVVGGIAFCIYRKKPKCCSKQSDGTRRNGPRRKSTSTPKNPHGSTTAKPTNVKAVDSQSGKWYQSTAKPTNVKAVDSRSGKSYKSTAKSSDAKSMDGRSTKSSRTKDDFSDSSSDLSSVISEDESQDSG